jgi:V8-like Glu-specific endopeptidase
MARRDVFEGCRSGVAQVCLEQGRERLTAGTAFLVSGGLVTNSHVLRDADFDVGVIRFEDMVYANGIRLMRDTLLAAVAHESPRDEHDIAFLRLNQPEFAGRHVFTFGDSGGLRVGDEAGFLGYPFQMQQLTCHVGYVSSLHRRGTIQVIQIDGSVNGGNSGGPLIDLNEGRVIGVVSRAEVGFLADQFDELVRSLRQNVEMLQRPVGARVVIAGIDPVAGLLASQAAMLQIAANLRRSANVGIGYAFGANYIRDRIGENHDSSA